MQPDRPFPRSNHSDNITTSTKEREVGHDPRERTEAAAGGADAAPAGGGNVRFPGAVHHVRESASRMGGRSVRIPHGGGHPPAAGIVRRQSERSQSRPALRPL